MIEDKTLGADCRPLDLHARPAGTQKERLMDTLTRCRDTDRAMLDVSGRDTIVGADCLASNGRQEASEQLFARRNGRYWNTTGAFVQLGALDTQHPGCMSDSYLGPTIR